MGIAFPIPVASYEFSGLIMPSFHNVTTVATDWGFPYVYIPSWLQGKIDRAYLDVYFPTVLEYSGADNDVSGDQIIEVQKFGGGAWQTAIDLNNHCLSLPASASLHIGRIIGNYDISTTCNSSVGSYIVPQWSGAKASGTGMRFRNCFCAVRILARG